MERRKFTREFKLEALRKLAVIFFRVAKIRLRLVVTFSRLYALKLLLALFRRHERAACLVALGPL